MFIAADKEYRGINLHEEKLKNKEERTTQHSDSPQRHRDTENLTRTSRNQNKHSENWGLAPFSVIRLPISVNHVTGKWLPVSQFSKTESSTYTQGNRGQAAIFDGYRTSNPHLTLMANMRQKWCQSPISSASSAVSSVIRR